MLYHLVAQSRWKLLFRILSAHLLSLLWDMPLPEDVLPVEVTSLWRPNPSQSRHPDTFSYAWTQVLWQVFLHCWSLDRIRTRLVFNSVQYGCDKIFALAITARDFLRFNWMQRICFKFPAWLFRMEQPSFVKTQSLTFGKGDGIYHSLLSHALMSF